jgi:hypothetical protein
MTRVFANLAVQPLFPVAILLKAMGKAAAVW